MNTPHLPHVAGLLAGSGLHATLGRLNARTPFRFTGVYRFDGATLSNVALFDRLFPAQARGADAPIGETFCAITGRLNDALLVSDGRHDRRYPWMRANAVISYCGAPIRDEAGTPLGTICHFDLERWPAQSEEAAFLLCIADMFVPFLMATLPSHV